MRLLLAKDDQDDAKSESGSSGIFSENSRPNSKANTEVNALRQKFYIEICFYSCFSGSVF